MRCRPLKAKKSLLMLFIYLSIFSGRFARKFAASPLGFQLIVTVNQLQAPRI